MTDPNGHVCPECETPRAPDGTPSCACARRASDALRDARTAEAAAAGDFDPLRIRPYVELGAAGAGGTSETPGTQRPAAGASPGEGAPSGSAGPAATAKATGADGDPSATVRLKAVPPDATMRLAALPSEPRAADVRLFQEQERGAGQGRGRHREAGRPTTPDGRPRRRRRTAVLVAAAATATVAAAAGFASGLFSYDTPARDTALPKDVRASVPDSSSEAASVSPSASASAPATQAPSASASASPSTSPSPSTSESAPESSASPSPSRSTAGPTQSSGTAGTTASAQPPSDTSEGIGATTLRRGDRGPEVTELQLRLRQLGLYQGGPDGRFGRHVEDAVRRYQWARGISGDEMGVYGRFTRASLESETTEP
ncbi:peptidoglycan-binding domain-containing protein [Streptomyces sp. 142MFCol3.1]|uniref:peptidoglycan-binding domain-containing protein n=1 Tax=Streptomyces sp. 142MFCol3.1 TaxID=1172179 RepID=UPI0003FCF532|nr:peptidoglycan-binding domain-containing protein [Streptomyces sp. 142MFCol3.1]